MKVIEYYKSKNQEHWKEEIGTSDWSAAKLLYSWLDTNQFKKLRGKTAKIYLLTDDNNLISFAILADQDEIDAPELSPWIGFVYTFPLYRGNHYAGRLIEHICDILKINGTKKVYLSTEEVGLYEKYGFSFLKTMTNLETKPTRVYIKRLSPLKNDTNAD